MNVCEYIYMYREKTRSTDIERPQELYWERERLQKTHFFLQALFHYLQTMSTCYFYLHGRKTISITKKKVFSNYDLK